jgi:toxin ParE1/3/4
MAHEINWAESAVASLVDAVEYIARDSPSYAAAFAVRVERAAASLQMFPERGRRVPEFNDPAVREISVDSHRLIYRVGPTECSYSHSSISQETSGHFSKTLRNNPKAG